MAAVAALLWWQTTDRKSEPSFPKPWVWPSVDRMFGRCIEGQGRSGRSDNNVHLVRVGDPSPRVWGSIGCAAAAVACVKQLPSNSIAEMVEWSCSARSRRQCVTLSSSACWALVLMLIMLYVECACTELLRSPFSLSYL
jgi:hypothetical protein